MNFLKKIIDSSEKHFTGSGKLKGLEPVFDAIKTVVFFPSPKNQYIPFVRDNLDLKRFMTFVLISLLPVLIFGIYNTGLQAGLAQGESLAFIQAFLLGSKYVLPIILVTYGVGLFW